ncbi:MAG: hypothetical protein U0822_22100 [Anaerolineae bacterium]
MSRETCTYKLTPLDTAVEERLAKLHALLIAHRYDAARGEQLDILAEATAGAVEYYDAPETVPCPPQIAVVQVLLSLAESGMREGMYLGYLAAMSGGTDVPAVVSAEVWAREAVKRLKLEDLMGHNLGFGYETTERATVALQDPVAR